MPGGVGGDVVVTAGQALGGDSAYFGGFARASGGFAARGTGGDLSITSGFGASVSSGGISVSSATAGESGRSGSVDLATGVASRGGTGALHARTGASIDGQAGMISVHVGAGDPSHDGVGGDLRLTGGAVVGSPASSPTSGAVNVVSGASQYTSSGDLFLGTSDAGKSGQSGMINITSGTTSAGSSGSLLLATGNASDGRGGSIGFVSLSLACATASCAHTPSSPFASGC